MTSKFRDKVSADNEREKSRGSSYGHLILPRDIKVFQVDGGDRVRFDILPYVVTDENHMCRNDEREVAVPGTEWYRKPYRLHRGIGANNESVICLSTFKKRCPICEYKAKLQKEGKSDEDETKALRYSERNLYVVVPIGHKKYDEALHIFDISNYCFQKALRMELEENPEYNAFADPSNEGFTINARFSEEEFGKNKYAAVSRIDFEERKKGYSTEFLKKVPNLDLVLSVLSYKEIEAKFFELDAETDDAPQEIDTDDAQKHKSRRVDEDEENQRTGGDEEPSKFRRRSKEDVDQDERPKRRSQVDSDEEKPKRQADRKDNENTCVACDGSGEDSRGRECHICKGTGIRKQKEQEDVDDKKEDDHKALKRRMKQEKQSSENKCPSNHKFGVDCDKQKECNYCDAWDACFDASSETE